MDSHTCETCRYLLIRYFPHREEDRICLKDFRPVNMKGVVDCTGWENKKKDKRNGVEK